MRIWRNRSAGVPNGFRNCSEPPAGKPSFSRTLEGTFPSLTNDRDLTLDARSSLGYRLCARDVHHYGPAGESLAVPKKPARPEVLRSVQQTAQFRATPSVSDQSTRSSRGRSRHEYQTAVSKTKLTASVSLQPTSTGRDRRSRHSRSSNARRSAAGASRAGRTRPCACE